MVVQLSDEILARIYDGVGTVWASEPVPGESGWAEGAEMREVYADVPCHLAFGQTKEADGGMLSKVGAVCVLFCPATYEIEPGSRVAVRQNGREYRIALTGVPRMFSMHQEIRGAMLAEFA